MICPNCRCSIPSIMHHCIYCGTMLPDGSEKTVSVNTKRIETYDNSDYYNNNIYRDYYGYRNLYSMYSDKYNNGENMYYCDYPDVEIWNRQGWNHIYNSNPYSGQIEYRNNYQHYFDNNMYDSLCGEKVSSNLYDTNLLLLLAGMGCIMMLLILAIIVILI